MNKNADERKRKVKENGGAKIEKKKQGRKVTKGKKVKER